MPPAQDSGEDSADRHQLADGRISRGFIAMEVEAAQGALSATALGLLAILRTDSSLREEDGYIDHVHLLSAAVIGRVPAAAVPKLLDELALAPFIEVLPDGGLLDLNHRCWGRTRDQREHKRLQERTRQANRRARLAAERAASQASVTSPAGDPVTPSVTHPSRRDTSPPAPPVTQMSRRDTAVTHAPVTDASRTPPVPVPVPVERQQQQQHLLSGPPRGSAAVAAADDSRPADAGGNGGGEAAKLRQMDGPPGHLTRLDELRHGAEQILQRPLNAAEERHLRKWEGLHRGSDPVPVSEILAAAGQAMAKRDSRGGVAATLGWANQTVQALCRQPLQDSGDYARALAAQAASAGHSPP
jgi:hypothetical protein